MVFYKLLYGEHLHAVNYALNEFSQTTCNALIEKKKKKQ